MTRPGGSDAELKPIERSPLYEEVAARLREFIAKRDLKPGDRLLPERELAEQLGVSRTSVRQALTAMRVMNLIEVRPGAGAFLAQPVDDLVPNLASAVAESEADHPMIWEVREAVEVQAARLAASRRTEKDIAALARAIEAMADSIEAGGDGIDGDRAFHRAISEAAHNPLLSDLINQLSEVIDRTSQVSLTLPGRAPRSVDAHRRILSAIEAEDPDRAAEAMGRHMAESAKSVVER